MEFCLPIRKVLLFMQLESISNTFRGVKKPDSEAVYYKSPFWKRQNRRDGSVVARGREQGGC